MNSRKLFYSSRLSARAIIAGTFAFFSLAFLFTLLGGGFGLFPTNFSEISQWTGGFWAWNTVSWIVSFYVGGYVAAMSSRSITKRDGLLHGFTVWTSAIFLSLIYFDITSSGTFMNAFTIGKLWACFFGTALALGSATLGGVQGSILEHRAQLVEERQYLQEKESKLKSAS